MSKFLGIASDALIEDMIAAIRGGNFEDIVTTIENCTQKGIDLHHFAKQMIMYLDGHLLEDTEFFIRLSSAFTEILQTVRHYAYPAIVYKIVLYNFLNPNTNTVPTPIKTPTPRAVNPTPNSVPSPVAPEVAAPIVESVSETSGPQDILTQLVARIDKDNLKRALQDHASIANHED